MWRSWSWPLALAVLLPALAYAEPPRFPAPKCSGDYADDTSVLVPRAREYERQHYSYALRNAATYECLSYGADGNLKRMRKRAVMHGTAFGYRQVVVSGAVETLLLTNQHAAEFPAVTDEDHAVDGVPAGCKKVAEMLRIVDSESDAYERDDVPLVRVVADPQLDVAILRAHAPLHVLPWRIGRSAALKERNVVEVRGFPLGAFAATNVGKVITAYDRDTFHEWDHDDFVVDALLSSGNSGSPVLAVSCKTGEFELVGIYHAGYAQGSALNVVVGIDQVRDMMTTLKRSPRGGHGNEPVALAARDRARLQSATHGLGDLFFPFGPLTAAVQRRSDGALVFQVMSRDFPLRAHPLVVFEDLPAGEDPGFGDLGRVWFGGPAGLRALSRSDLDADAQALALRVLDALRRDALATFAYRNAAREAPNTRERFDQVSRAERTLKRTVASRRDQAQNLTELAERLQPQPGQPTVGIADAFAVPIPGEEKPMMGQRGEKRAPVQ